MKLREAVDRLFEDSFVRPTIWSELAVGGVPVDMYQTAENIVVKASLPGVNPDEIDISITGGILTIKGEHKADKEAKDEDYLRKEHRYGMYIRSVNIPVEVQSEKAEATYENGILTLIIPKAEKVKPKTVKVRTKGTIEGKKKAD
jgi:HSP20 family protein